MPRKASETVPEGNDPVPQLEKFGSGEPTLVDVYRFFQERFDKQQNRMDSFFDGMDGCFDRRNRKLDEISDETRVMDEHVSSLEHGARQPRLAMKANGHANTKTQERTEGAATAVQAMRGDSCTTAQKVQDGPKTSITFGVEVEPPDLPCRNDVLVKGSDAAPRSCLPSFEMRSPTAVGGLLPTGEASTATRTTSNEPLLWFYATEEMNPEEDSKKETLWTSIPSACYDSSFWRLLAAPYCRMVVETKSRQNTAFDPGGSQGHLRACSFLGSWRVLVCGKIIRARAAGDELQRFIEGKSLALEASTAKNTLYREKVLPSRAA